MNELRKMELESIIENIELELEFTDLTAREEQEQMKDLESAKEELTQLQKVS